MKRLAHWLVRLYPRAWRERYGEEYHALLDDCGPGQLNVFDVFRGGMAMRIRTLSGFGWTALGALLGLIVMLGWLSMRQDLYVSTATISTSLKAEELARSVNAAAVSGLSRANLFSIIVRHNLFPKERRTMPAETVVEHMKQNNIRISRVAGQEQSPGAAMITFVYPDPRKAQIVAGEIQQLVIAAGEGMSVLESPNLPRSPFYPNRSFAALLGVLGGALLGVLAFLAQRLFARRPLA